MRALAIVLISVTVGCQQKMGDQPSYRPLQASSIFPQGMSARQLPEGALAREWPLADDPMLTGLKSRSSPDTPSDPGNYANVLPFELARGDLDRGQERYTIYCAVCHDPVGTGAGKVPERGYVKPPNFHTDSSRGFALYRRNVPLREVPVGYIFQVVSRGYGAMPRHGFLIVEKDRWRIAAYVRALQVSQHAEVDTLPPAVRQALGVPP
jgi:mono/diheme cytochrome c family protein